MSDQLYKNSGVDVDLADQLVDWLKEGKQPRQIALGEMVSGVGGFAALFRPNFQGIADPLLVTSTDGVGTKVLLGTEFDQLTGLGQDLVAMCFNDLYTLGARPLFFLDYFATGRLDPKQFKQVLAGIKKAVLECKALLMGGETAEMPGLYGKGHFDLAGFVVGVVDGQNMLGANHVREGDSLFALKSSGFHSNGYSLIRKWLAEKPVDTTMMERLMLPTQLYHQIPDLLQDLGTNVFHAAANITGGGISGNLPRVLPPWALAKIEMNKIPTHSWMKEFIESNGADLRSTENVFNLGCGMIAVIEQNSEKEFIAASERRGLSVKKIGHLEKINHQTDAKTEFI